MTSLGIAVIVFGCVFAGAMLGMFLRSILPERHLSDSAKDVVRLAMGLIATMTALVLGLVTASAKSSYDAQVDAVKHSAVKILLLDRLLANYGPETREARVLLRNFVANRVSAIWPEDRFQHVTLEAPEAAFVSQEIEARILRLSPQSEAQRWLQSQALQVGGDLLETRWLMVGERGNSIPLPFLLVVVFWLTIIFASFGLFAPRNGTVVGTLLLCALSVAGAMLLILEMDRPFEGLMKVSGAPLRYALAHLGQ